uniref:Uncharacterized protein n=1 Tax=Arundo donax TaxID=35708 RepID=A0A0A9U6V3_ARUDO
MNFQVLPVQLERVHTMRHLNTILGSFSSITLIISIALLEKQNVSI